MDGPDGLPKPKIISCRLCQHRKVKCDRAQPACSYCIKHKVNCLYIQPAPVKRKRKLNDEELRDRLRRCEETIRAHGLSIDDETAEREESVGPAINQTASSPASEQLLLPKSEPIDQAQSVSTKFPGTLIVEGDKTVFVENGIWNTLSEELQSSPGDILRLTRPRTSATAEGTSSASEIVIPAKDILFNGSNALNVAEMRSSHPSAINIFKLWQVFLENVHPLTKFVHAPTLQKSIIEWSERLNEVKKAGEALLFGIYFSAVQSMTNDECQTLLGETKPTLIRRFEAGLRTALIQADFMNCNDITVLQAYMLYLMPMRHYQDASSLWILTGVSVRTAQRMGMHRDGTTIGLSPFDTEMRRRLWFAVTGLDSQMAEFCGIGSTSAPPWSTTKPSLNINDSELDPDMSVFPKEREGATEMVFIRLRHEISTHIRGIKSRRGWINFDEKVSKTEETHITELRAYCEEKYFKHCDPSVPLHLFTLLVGRSMLMVLELVANHRRRPRDGQQPLQSMSVEERDAVYSLSSTIIDVYNKSIDTPSIQRFLWHINVHFQWHAFIILSSELAFRQESEETQRGWQLIGRLLDHNPDVITNQGTNLNKAVRRLLLRAWSVREAHLQKVGAQIDVPVFIQYLKSQEVAPVGVDNQEDPVGLSNMERRQAAAMDLASLSSGVQFNNTHQDGGLHVPNNMPEIPFDENIFMTPINWEEWDNLLSETDMFYNP